jgi:hypothetical protein
MARLAAATLCLCAFNARADDYSDRMQKLENFAATNRIGTDRNYWLTIQNAMGDAEKIAFVFGMMDDLAFCNEMADAYRARYPSTRLFCIPAN